MATKKAKRTYTNSEYVALVPVIISIRHGDTVLQDYEEEIAISFAENTSAGKHNAAKWFSLKTEKNMSTESALFTIASDMVRDEAKNILSRVNVSAHETVHLHVKRNGEISYSKYIGPRL